MSDQNNAAGPATPPDRGSHPGRQVDVSGLLMRALGSGSESFHDAWKGTTVADAMQRAERGHYTNWDPVSASVGEHVRSLDTYGADMEDDSYVIRPGNEPEPRSMTREEWEARRPTDEAAMSRDVGHGPHNGKPIQTGGSVIDRARRNPDASAGRSAEQKEYQEKFSPVKGVMSGKLKKRRKNK